MSSVLLAVHSYPGGDAAFLRHVPYFERQRADAYAVIAPVNGGCTVPPGWSEARIGDGLYLNGRNLCDRLIDTFGWFLITGHSHMLLCEYDTVIQHQLPVVPGISAHLAGTRTWDSPASYFIHNPWSLDRSTAERLIPVMNELVGGAVYGSAISSPDVFLAYACETAGIQPSYPWRQYSQNCFDLPGSLEAAREAWRSGVHCIHGCKSEAELKFIIE